MISPPCFPLEFSDLPIDPRVRHEVLVSVFGSMLMSMRNQSLSHIANLIENKSLRDQVRAVDRGVYEDIARLPPEGQEAALKLMKKCVDLFARTVLTMLSGDGSQKKLGSSHAVNYRLVMEILTADDGEIILEEIINRGGEKFFPEYWGRWLNQGPKG